MPFGGFHDRLRLAFDHRPPREIAEILGVNPEFIRRVIGGQEPPIDFIAVVCKRFDVSADWLLLGRGPMRLSELRLKALQQIPAVDLVGSLNVCVRRMLEDGVKQPKADLTGKPPHPPGD